MRSISCTYTLFGPLHDIDIHSIETKHPLTWSNDDVGFWVLREFPHQKDINKAFVGRDGKFLWFLTRPQMVDIGFRPSACEMMWNAVQSLHRRFEKEDILRALEIQKPMKPRKDKSDESETDESETDANWDLALQLIKEDIQGELHDQYYCEMIGHWSANSLQQSQSDALLASRLQMECNAEGESLRLAEQLWVDAELAQRMENLEDEHEVNQVVAQFGRHIDIETHDIPQEVFEPLPDDEVINLFDRRATCNTCFSTTRVLKLKCAHRMCEPCLRILLKTALSDRSLIPLKCCKQFIAPIVVQLLNGEDLTKFVECSKEKNAKDICIARVQVVGSL